MFGIKEEIESGLGYKLEWNSGNAKSSTIMITKKTDVFDESKWEEYINWHLKRASEFYEVFAEKVKNF